MSTLLSARLPVRSILTTLTLAAALPLAVAPQPAAAQTVDAALLDGLSYRSVNFTRGGRVTAVAGHAAQPNTFYMGGTGGGVFKTTDAGESWEPISDQQIATGSIGAIDVARTNPNIVYVGTGSAAIRSNVIVGKGVWRSDDAGQSWRHVGLPDVGQIGELVIHPTNPDVVFVAAVGQPFGPNPERGVYRTRNGGQSWDRVLFISDSTGVSDLDVDPSNPDVIYAGAWRAERKPWTIISGAMEGGVYKSTNGGDSWDKLTNGLPRGMTGKISISVSPARPNRVFALIEALPDEIGLYRTDNAGATWSRVSDNGALVGRPFYYTYVDADPVDPELVYVNNLSFQRSRDGGATWERVNTPHGDNHGIWINPGNPDIFIQSNDGGVNVTQDGGETWTTQMNQPTAEIYQVAVDNREPYRLYGAQQDNSTVIVSSEGRGEFEGGPGCETGPILPHPTKEHIVYGACKGRHYVTNQKTGQTLEYSIGSMDFYGFNPRDMPYRVQRVAPQVSSPHDPDVLYFGTQFVHRTRDMGATWETISPDLTWNPAMGHVRSGTPITEDITGEEYYSVLYDIMESPVRRGVIWAGSNDGLVHVTQDDGRSWTNVTPADFPEGGRINIVEPSPHDPARAYFASYRFLFNNDFAPYIYRTDDYGQTWTRLTTGNNGIAADNPTRVIREDPERAGLLYAGTDDGMYISFNDGANWQPFQQNLPITPITDIELAHGDVILSTMGRAFWILDDRYPLFEMSPAVAQEPVHLYDIPTAYRGGDGALISYSLASAPSGNVTLEIVDASGNVVSTVESAAGAAAAGQQGMRGGQGRFGGGGGRSLTAERGLNRYTWNLSDTDGMGVLPGRYTARIRAGGATAEKPLRVEILPALVAEGITVADLREQRDMTLQVQALSEQARDITERIEAAKGTLQQRNATALLTRLEAIEDAFVNERGSAYPERRLNTQIGRLSSLVSRGERKVGNHDRMRYDELVAEVARHEAALNRLLTEAGIG